MERELGKDLEQGKKRVAFLMDNCDAVEEKGYMKPCLLYTSPSPRD